MFHFRLGGHIDGQFFLLSNEVNQKTSIFPNKPEESLFQLKRVFMSKISSAIFSIFFITFPVNCFASQSKLVARASAIKQLTNCTIGSEVFEALDLHEVTCDEKDYNSLTTSSYVKFLKNAPIAKRAIPNDDRFGELWNFVPSPVSADVSAVKAWNISRGNFSGQEAVVAVIDGGVDIEHEDLADNIWINQQEIPGNNVDDDNNGYVDDINGWNVYRNVGQIEKDNHGTHVAGIIGAKGNNQIGVTGINWKTKIMGISGASGDTITVLKAYNYVLKQKKLYLESNGSKGANIVATNSSFGIDYADCNSTEYTLWNDVYEELGKVGILNVVATINNEVNVDVEGDVPSGCDSEYVISVTNTNIDNEKYQFAGFGKKSIDLGAPGTDILSTVPNDGYAFMTGTSMATPHVAGAIAFLSQLKNEKFNKTQIDEPRRSAEVLKEILLNSTDSVSSLKRKTLSGGKLNLFESAKRLLSY